MSVRCLFPKSSHMYIYRNGEIINNSANMYSVNLLPKRVRLSASPEVKNQQLIKKLSYNIYILQKQYE